MDNNAKNKKIIRVWTGVVVVLAVLFGILYLSGFRFSTSFGIGKVGVVNIKIPRVDTTVIIDQSRKIVTTRKDQNVELKLSPRDHEIIVSLEGYYPWIKSLEIGSGSELTLSPIFVLMNTSGVTIPKTDSEYTKILSSITSYKFPTKDTPLSSTDSLVKIWVEDNKIMSQTGETVETVLTPETEVRNISFYKDRSDNIIFSTANGVFVIEIEKDGVQNFMPIYIGTKPSFVLTEPNSIYVEDNGLLMQVTI